MALSKSKAKTSPGKAKSSPGKAQPSIQELKYAKPPCKALAGALSKGGVGEGLPVSAAMPASRAAQAKKVAKALKDERLVSVITNIATFSKTLAVAKSSMVQAFLFPLLVLELYDCRLQGRSYSLFKLPVVLNFVLGV